MSDRQQEGALRWDMTPPRATWVLVKFAEESLQEYSVRATVVGRRETDCSVIVICFWIASGNKTFKEKECVYLFRADKIFFPAARYPRLFNLCIELRQHTE